MGDGSSVCSNSIAWSLVIIKNLHTVGTGMWLIMQKPYFIKFVQKW